MLRHDDGHTDDSLAGSAAPNGPMTSITPEWIFGYGSLIWKPDFDYVDARLATVRHWSRRFWQGSHDHRGTPEAPGRVVTLVPEPGARCTGMAYLLDAASARAAFTHLDVREQNGYDRVRVPLEFPGDPSETAHPASMIADAEATLYLANAQNVAWLGDAPLPVMARQISASHGPSGSNREYLLNLDRALRALDVEDPHVHLLAEQVLQLPR